MKNLKSLKLHRLGEAEMTKREMNALTGGTLSVCVCCCSCSCSCSSSCSCKYAGEQEGPDDSYFGGSSTTDNSSANEYNAKVDTENSGKNKTNDLGYKEGREYLYN